VNRSIRHQDNGGPLALFVDGQFVRVATAADEAARDRGQLLGGLSGSVEFLLVCPNHPTVSAVDCTTCVPLEDE
jgi:hypothetical protein